MYPATAERLAIMSARERLAGLAKNLRASVTGAMRCTLELAVFVGVAVNRARGTP
jgi:hypothetical protein